MRFRRFELDFYKKHNPYELEKIGKENVNLIFFIDKFLKDYDYNYVTKKWSKKKYSSSDGILKKFQDILRIYWR